MDNCSKCSDENKTCSSVGTQYANVSIPINIKPYGMVGNIKTECCGQPTVSLIQRQCGNGSCGCEVIITQTVCITIPLEYGTMTEVGASGFSCKKSL